MELWNSGDLDYQLWNISNLGNGYYKIVNAYNNKAISVKTGEENQDSSRIIQKSYNGSFSQQWKITITNRGYYKIAPRSGEAYSTDWCMSADDGILFANGWKIEQKEYTDNTYLRDEWCIIPCTTWVEFSYDNGMLQRHKLNNESDDITKARLSNTIINDHFSIISLFFENICGVCLNNNQSAALYYLSDADNCSIDLDQHCSDISSCVLRWDDNPYNNNSTNGFQYNAHHKNIIRLRNNLIVGIPDHTIRITYTGHNCCYSDRSGIPNLTKTR